MNIKKIIREEIDDSLKWIQDVLAVRLSEYENWILVNDIAPRSKKEGREIQNYLFNLGYSWSRYRSDKELKDFCIYGIYHYANNSKTMYYHDGCREAEIKITNEDIESGEWKVYYWSQINPVVMKEESGELDWIKKELSNKGPLDGIRFRVPRSIASRSINVIEDKDGDNEWVSVFWQTDDKGDMRSERYSRVMVERYLNDGWWRRLN